MSIFDKAYDEMSMAQVCSRLPGELSIRALKRRILNLDTLYSFIEINKHAHNNVQELKWLVNGILASASLDEIFEKFKPEAHPVLFQWLDDSNTKRIKDNAKDKLTTTFRFNLTDSTDEAELSSIMDKVLAEDLQGIVNTMDPNCQDCTSLGEACDNHYVAPTSENSSKRIRAVLDKASPDVFKTLVEKVLADKRPEVKASVLGVVGSRNRRTLTDNQMLIALKAFAKADTSSLRSVKTLSYSIFAELRPLERLAALEKYFAYYPEYRKLEVFDPMPTLEEFKFLLFSCTVEHYERVETLISRFRNITELDPPVHEDDEDV